jgi:hypothetical protein
MLWQILQSKSAEKGFPSSLHYAATREQANATKPTFRSFLPPQLPQPLFPTFVGNRAATELKISFFLKLTTAL